MGFARAGSNPAHGVRGTSSNGRALALHARGSGIDAHVLQRTFGVVVTYFPSKEMPRFRLPEGALLF